MVALRTCQKIAGSGKYHFNTLIFGTAIVVGSIGVFVPEVLGLGNYEINQMLSAHYELSFILLLMITKIFVTALCIGFGFFGGVFGPALFVGAALGGVEDEHAREQVKARLRGAREDLAPRPAVAGVGEI